MYVQIERDDQRLLVELVEARLRELPAEIRRSRDFRYHDKLQKEKETLARLLQSLHEAECDVQA